MMFQKTFQAQQDGPHIFARKGPLAPKWHIVDATGMIVGRLATVLARVLTGKHKPTYTKHADTGDFVIVLNAGKVQFTGKKWDQKKYYDYSGYIGGLKEKSATEMLERHPEEILRRAVWGMTNKSQLARKQMKKLKIYLGSEHPHEAQEPKVLAGGAVRRTILSKE